MEKGYTIKRKRAKEGAYETIDNVTKFALDDSDWEEYEEWVEYTPEQYAEGRIAELKRFLADTDYVAAKIAEGAATREDYADVLAQRQAWRDEINALGNPEKTCSLLRVTLYDEEGIDGFKCDECGFSDTLEVYEPLPNRCPRCGLLVDNG